MYKFGKSSRCGPGLVLAFVLGIVLNTVLLSPASAQGRQDTHLVSKYTGPSANADKRGAGSTTRREARRLFLQAKAFHDGVGHDGIRAEKNLAKARYYYLKSAGLGNNDAKLNLGYLYFVGEGVKQDYVKAHNWYLSAARTGSKEAQTNLAMMYKNGLGVKKDQAEAGKWLKYGQETNAQAKQKVVKPEEQGTPKPVGKNEKLPSEISEKTLEKAPEKTGKKAVTVEKKPSSFAALGGDMLASALRIQEQKLPKPSSVPTRTNTKPAEIVSNSANRQASQSVGRQEISVQNRQALKIPQGEPVFNLPGWVGYVLVLVLLLLSVLGSVWFVRQYGALLDIARGRAFVTAFYARHRDSLRTDYLKYPERQNACSRMGDPWALAMCVLMVRFAQENSQADSRLGEQSRGILKAYKTGSFNVRKCVFKFVASLQARIISDIYAYDCARTDGPAPIQYAQKTKFNNVVNLHNSVVNRQNSDMAMPPSLSGE